MVAISSTSEPGTSFIMPSSRELVFSRVVNASRSVVFDAVTNPARLRRWYGLIPHTMTTCEIDLRPGGAWRHVLRAPDGQEFRFRSEYLEILPPLRLVYAEGFEQNPGHEHVLTMTFEQRGDQTLLTVWLRYKSAADRERHLRSGIQAGMREMLDRLDAFLTS